MKSPKILALPILIGALTACSSTTIPTTTSSSPTPVDVSPRCETFSPDPNDANAVADAAAATLSCHDTRTDSSPFDATRRASTWLSPTLTEGLPTAAPASTAWTEQTSHNAYDQVSVEPVIMENEPNLSTSPVIITRFAVATPIGDDEWKGAPEETYFSFTLTRQEDGTWIITNVQI